ncbi:MAG: cupin domain-containing protein [Anaerolineales bacterium]|nr:MAG: cupin domain-containing protein [Anaerolineales bacterium]
MHHTTHLDQLPSAVPAGYGDGKSAGYTRRTYVEQGMGSVHMGTGISQLEPGGHISHHLHAFEESFYILEGSLLCQIGDAAYELGPGHYGLIPTGTPHAWQNKGSAPARWVEMQAPQPRPEGGDTFFVAGELAASGQAPDPARAAETMVSHFDEGQLPKPGEPGQMEGFNATTGVAIKMFVDRSSGATHQSLFLIQYQPGAKIDAHDHTFEESYYIVSGLVKAVADGETYELGAGDLIWTSVGCIHSFEQMGDEPVRWIETQAPLPPAKEAFRFERDWSGKYSG